MTLLQRIGARLALALGQKPDDGTCPPPEDVVAWQEGALASAEAARVKAHVAHCETCFAMWTGLLAVGQAEDTAPAASSARSRWWRSWRWVMPALAMGVVAVALIPTLLGPAPDGAFPAYTISAQAGLEVRGAGDEALTLSDGSALEIVLAPETASDETVDVFVYAEVGGALSTLEVPYSVTDKGVVVVDAIVGEELVVPDGTRALWVVLARSGSQPGVDSLADSVASDEPVTGDGWRAWRIEVD